MNYICALFHISMAEELFEQLAFEPNALFEKMIEDLMDRHYSVVPDFLSAAETESLKAELLRNYHDDAFKKAAIGNQFNEQIRASIRGDFILWLDRESQQNAERLFLTKIDGWVAYLNKTCFLGIAESEFHYALYPEGTFYKRHLDTFQHDDRRRLSVICYLNPADWQQADGGELVIYTTRNGEEHPVTIYPWPGQLVVFESQVLEHEVLPARRNRLSITGWLKTR